MCFVCIGAFWYAPRLNVEDLFHTFFPRFTPRLLFPPFQHLLFLNGLSVGFKYPLWNEDLEGSEVEEVRSNILPSLLLMQKTVHMKISLQMAWLLFPGW